MERAPRNSHEKVYIDMSIIVIDIKKKIYCIGKHMVCGVISFIRSNWWCYPTSRVFSIFLVFNYVSVLMSCIIKVFIYFQVRSVTSGIKALSREKWKFHFFVYAGNLKKNIGQRIFQSIMKIQVKNLQNKNTYLSSPQKNTQFKKKISWIGVWMEEISLI